ncbi:MAG: hypothetical protein ABSC47_11160 [Terracidiphilus sp.]
MQRVVFCAVVVALLTGCVSGLRCQTTNLPTTYTVTESNAMFGPTMMVKVYRSGSKALVDSRSGPDWTGPKPVHMRALYDLSTQRSLSWDLNDSSVPCGNSTFSGSWGDPFEDSAGMLADLNKQNPRLVTTQIFHGIPAKILEADGPDGKTRVWVDDKYGLLLKALMTPASGAPRNIIEVMDVSYSEPPASLFAVPANCAAAAAAPRVPTEEESIAALTGGNAQDFVKAIYGPGSQNSCSMLFRVVKAGAMEPIASGYQVGVDLNVATEPTPSYKIGIGANGHSTFSGGGLHEVTSQIRNGVLRLDNIPAQFELDAEFGTAGSTSANIYRQCFAPQMVLLFVVKNPANIGEGGEFLWVKSGQYATVPH